MAAHKTGTKRQGLRSLLMPPWQLWLCSAVQLTNSTPLYADDGKKTTEGLFGRAVNPCREARLVEPTRDLHRDDSRLSETSEPSIVA